MKWHEILGGILLWLIGFWLWTKCVQFRKNRYFNDSWKTRKRG